MDKDLYGNEEYSAEDLGKMSDREVEELGYCPRCISKDNVKAQLRQGSGCASCVRCGWSPCKVG